VTKRQVWWGRLLSRPVQVVIDLWIMAIAFSLAYLLRFEFALPASELSRFAAQLPVVLGLQFLSFLAWGIYSFIWRYVGIAEIWTFGAANLTVALPLAVARFLLPGSQFQTWRVPLSIIILNSVLSFTAVIGVRVLRRVIHERFERQQNVLRGSGAEAKPVLLVGAGRAGVLAAREVIGRGDLPIEVKGFVDDDPLKQGTVVNGIRVLGTTAELPDLVRKYQIDHVIITIASASRKEVRRIVDLCDAVPVKARIIPGLYEILDGRVEVSSIRDVQIEDLLGRDPVRLDEGLLQGWIGGKTVLVSGAGGSIGSELVRQVLRFKPATLVLVERSEFALYTIHEEIAVPRGSVQIVPALADLGDTLRMREVFEKYRPDVVLHAAAHKHVPMIEWNPMEAVKNNVLATRAFGELAAEYGSSVFVLISTDKAVNPTSVMGTTKRLAELIVQDLDSRHETRYVAVRFGNVLGSTGSVVPKFRAQIAAGGPVTVTHPEMRRYFMTIPEAAQLVLQAGAMGEGGEIFILDMGEPVRIVDLARDMISLSGFRPDEDVEIAFTGLRPGEKLFEELDTSEEKALRTRHPKILIGRISGADSKDLRHGLERLEKTVRAGDDVETLRTLASLIPESSISIPSDGGSRAQTSSLEKGVAVGAMPARAVLPG
jgi:FlaA1/EpsC-like NDP-sugar epimerase